VKAVQNGVPPERVAVALNTPVRIVHASMRLLDGIYEEAAHLLKDKNISQKAIRLLKRPTGLRQIEIAEPCNRYCYISSLTAATIRPKMHA
jgi:hypothetical protein